MLKYARGCVETASETSCCFQPSGKAMKENRNSYYNVEIHEAQAYGNLRLLLPLTRRFTLELCCLEDGVSEHLFHALVCLITIRVIINDPEHHLRVLSISFNTCKVGSLCYEDFILMFKWMNAKVFMTVMPVEQDNC
ncbi:hypothetical protein E5288_WYG015820 [Bos mutus]|uniref:Uncharacterized protein n=1 Tax=Bos mutus TaxID=72004 RepID=A0A6B0RGR7_9CETA|nr:hypothetical protein [Bos mutus]